MSEFERLSDEFFAFWWLTHPTDATAVGVHTHDGELERRDADSREEHVRRCGEFLDAFERVSPASEAHRIDRALITNRLRLELHDLETVRSFERNPLPYLEAPLGALYLMAVRDYAPGAERARRAAERLVALPRALDEARENLTAASPVLVRTALELARSGLALLRGALPLSLGAAVQDDPAEYDRWENARRGAEDAVVDWAEWLESELLPRADGDFALGAEAYEAVVRYAHGLAYGTDEIEDYGRSLKRETEAALQQVAEEIEPGAGWRELVHRIKAEHPAADELIDAYAAEMERARAFVTERGLADVPPNAELEVTPTPEFLRPLIPYAAYLPPAAGEVDQTGFFLVTPPPAEQAQERLRGHALPSITITAVHEGYPGHHLQLARANRADSEPRRVFRTPVMAEGWALYCEELMRDEGFYDSAPTRLFQLKNLLWRACRVVVDVGLHARGWSPERAVGYLVREAGLERGNAEIEVRRYCAEPTQPMSYAVGRRELLRLRRRYRERRGAAFDSREFHDRLLSWGTIPPPLIARGLALT